MTQPSNLKVKRLVELDALPAYEGDPAWLYAVQNNKDYKIDLVDLSADIGEAAGEVAAEVVKDELAETSGASLVGFLQAGTDAVPRTIQSKLREWPSVKDFGAIGDGTTNDYVALQRAINSGVKHLYWPAGTYMIGSSLKPVNNQTWAGDAGQTMIKVSASAATNTNAIAHNTDGLDGPLVNFSMSGFTVDGAAKEAGMVLYGCQTLRITDCVFQNCETYGLGLQARPGAPIDEAQDDIILTRCQFNYNGVNTVFDGLDVKYCTNTVLESCSAVGNTDAGLNLRGANIDLIGCQAVDNGTAGILLQANYEAGNPSYMRVIGGQASGTTGGPGLEIQGDVSNITYIEMSAFQAYSNTGSGVRFSGSGQIVGNITALQSRDNTLHGVHVTHGGSLIFNGGLLASNDGDGFRTADDGAVLNGVVMVENVGAGYREDTGANNNYLLPTCVVSWNGTDIAARVGVEVDRGFWAVKSTHSMRAFPGQASGLELQTDSSAGAHSTVLATGTAASVGLRMVTKGNGMFELMTQNGSRTIALFRPQGTAAVNYPDFVASTTASPVLVQAIGTDTNIDLQLNAKGTGRIRFGALTASADAPVTGYITIKDAGGTERKLAVIA